MRRSLAFAALPAAALLLGAGPGAAAPALWKVSSGEATMYLFGTVHMLPRDTVWMDPAIEKALAASREMWTEADVSNLGGMVAAIRRYGLKSGPEVKMELPPAYRARFEQQVAVSGLNPELFKHARPWLADILLSGGAMQHAGVNAGLGVEPTLLAYARTHHMATANFETAEGQFALLADLPEDAQIDSLEQAIDEFDATGALFGQMIAAWSGGDVARLDALTNQPMRKRNERIWTDLIVRRNAAFAQKIADRLQGPGTAFAAVGAAHLCGADSVQMRLGILGFTVERVQ